MKQIIRILPILILSQCASWQHIEGKPTITSFLPLEYFKYIGNHSYQDNRGYASEISINLNDTNGTIFLKLPNYHRKDNEIEFKDTLQPVKGWYCLEYDFYPCGILVDCLKCTKDTSLTLCFKGNKSIVYYNYHDRYLHCALLDTALFNWSDFAVEKGTEDTANLKLLLKDR